MQHGSNDRQEGQLAPSAMLLALPPGMLLFCDPPHLRVSLTLSQGQMQASADDSGTHIKLLRSVRRCKDF